MTKHDIKELSIQVNLNGLSFCILNRSTNTVELLRSTSFNNKLTPNDALSRLKTEIVSNNVFSADFNSVQLIHQNELATLVPQTLFDENHKADYLKFNSKILRTDFITHDDITVSKSANVYVPYVNVNNYIFETFGAFVYKHSSSVLIDAVLQLKRDKDKPEVFINVNHNTFELLVVENKQVLLFNVFDYTTKEDFIYYILFVLEQLKLDSETIPVHLSGNVNKDDELYSILYTYVRYVHLIKNICSFKVAESEKPKTLHQHYLILNSF